jgi:hypothetical protein
MNTLFANILLLAAIVFGGYALGSISGRYGPVNKGWNIWLAVILASVALIGAARFLVA